MTVVLHYKFALQIRTQPDWQFWFDDTVTKLYGDRVDNTVAANLNLCYDFVSWYSTPYESMKKETKSYYKVVK
jgi:hypothetical protein